jgi:hypothetical protein
MLSNLICPDDAPFVQELMQQWVTYFPTHLVPYVFSKVGDVKITLTETDTYGYSSTGHQEYGVSASCEPWEYWTIFGVNTCDFVTGVDLVTQPPRRAPDYYSFGIAGGKEAASGGLSVTITHNGDVFAGYSGALGPSASVLPGSVQVTAGYVGSPGTDPPSDSAIDGFVGGWGLETDAVLGPFDIGLLLGTDGTPGVQYTLQSNLSAGVTIGANCSIQIQGGVPGLNGIAPWDNQIGGGGLPTSTYVAGIAALVDLKSIFTYIAGYVLTHVSEAEQCNI